MRTFDHTIETHFAISIVESDIDRAKKSFAKETLTWKQRRLIVKIEVSNAIVFSQMNVKYYYDNKHQSLIMKVDDQALIRLHREYDIFSISIFEKKLRQQYVDSFKILEKIDRLVYRLNLSSHWRIHSILFVTQLKSTSLENDLFDRQRSTLLDSIFVRDNIDKIKSYELNRVIDKRSIARRNTKYLVRWKEYESK